MIASVNLGEVVGQEYRVGERAAPELCQSGRGVILEYPNPKSSGYVLLKFMLEWLIALGLLGLTAPLIAALAALIKLTSAGPSVYAQTRLGRDGRKYRIFKLRTMVHGAETRTGPVWASKDDCRITPLGRILRNTHLDELPQLWNVIRGDMALIGPRPERPEIAARIEQHVPEFRTRLRMRPGVTGLAQMTLPADDPNDHHFAGVRKKLAHDLFYIREVSLLLDIRIASCTTCYFLGTAMEAVRHSLVRSYSAAVERSTVPFAAQDPDCERAA